MEIRPFRPEDAGPLAELAAACARGETDFVLNPLWEEPEEVFADFDRFGIDPAEHLLVAEDDEGRVATLAGFLRRPRDPLAGLICPIVRREDRGQGLGGRVLREALARGSEKLGVKVASAAVGVRNRAGYALLASQGFRPTHQVYLMRCDRRPEPAPLPVEGLVVEEATPERADELLALFHACGFEERSDAELRALIEDPRARHLVARRGDELVAFVELAMHWPRRPWVAYVGVVVDLRQRGLATALVSRAVSEAFERSAEHALLLLSPANRTALRAYEKVGFHRHRLLDVLVKGL